MVQFTKAEGADGNGNTCDSDPERVEDLPDEDGEIEALKNISLDIGKGDIYGIIGMSGAGKSTLVRCLNFLERPTEGTVLIDGVDLAGCSDKELRKVRNSVAMIFQHFNLLMQRTVLDNVCFALEILGERRRKPGKRPGSF